MTTLDERIRRLVADEVATAPEPPRFDAIVDRSPALPVGRPRSRTIALAALATAAAVVAGAVVVGSVVRATEHDQVTAGPLAVAAPRQHLLPGTVPDGLVLAEAADAADPEPFGPPITTQVFTRSDGALVRLAVDPWQGSGSSAVPVGFQPVTVRGGEGGWRDQTLGYGLLWFRVGATRVVIQTHGLSAGEAIAAADALGAARRRQRDRLRPPRRTVPADVRAARVRGPRGRDDQLRDLGRLQRPRCLDEPADVHR